jgi:PEGA domain
VNKTCPRQLMPAVVAVGLWLGLAPAGHAAPKSEHLERARAIIARQEKVPEEVLNKELRMLTDVVDVQADPNKLNDEQKLLAKAMTAKEVPPEDVGRFLAAVWVETRLGRKDVPKDRALRWQDFADAIDDMIKLTVRTKPPGAEVALRVESNTVGTTELRSWVLPGKLRVIIRKEGYVKSDETIDVPKRNHLYEKELEKEP